MLPLEGGVQREGGRRRVLVVYKHYAPDTGGIETSLRQYVKWYRQAGFSVSVLCCRKRGLETRIEEIDNVRIVRCGSFGILKSVPISPSFFWYYLRELQCSDLVHVHLQFPFASLGYWLFGRWQRCRWLVTYHMDVHRQKWLKRLTYPFDRYLLKRAEGVVTSSPALRDTSEVLSSLNRPIDILPFTLEGFAPALHCNASEDDDLPASGYFLFFGRLVEYKGTRPLVEAIKRCVIERPDIRFVVFGRGPERSAFERLATDYPAQVTYIPEFVSEERKYHLIERAAAVLFPSVYSSEAFGIAQLEAMASGKPLINCRLNTGVNWVAPDGVCALTIEPQDVTALVEAISELSDNQRRREALAEAASERYEKEFSESIISSRFKNIIDALF